MTLITEAGVEKDREGQRRTIYSLRHTYATFRLHEGVNHYCQRRRQIVQGRGEIVYRSG